jgi:hypothetical protein
MTERTYLQLPINADQGFPQALRLSFAGQVYVILLYVNVPENNRDAVLDLPTSSLDADAQQAFMVMRVTRDSAPAQTIFQRKLVRNMEYRAAELAFVFRQLRVARQNLNGIGSFGSAVVGGVALWDS